MNSLPIEDFSTVTETDTSEVSGEFLEFEGERWYAIRNVDRMDPFFISVISDVDHWLFASSTGGLTAGRISPDTALFPYVTVDKIHDSLPHTGSKTVFRVASGGEQRVWEPFNREHDHRHAVTRNLYKNLLGDKLCFEEINHDLCLAFHYTWSTSDRYGFVRDCSLKNLGDRQRVVALLDGLQNLLPAGTPRFAQTNTSNLVDAYKWSELDESTGLAFLSLYSGITDRAEPCESLKATTVFHLGLDRPEVLVSSEQVKAFQSGAPISTEARRRGIRAAYFVSQTVELAAAATQRWSLVANLEQSQADVVKLRRELADRTNLAESIERSIASGHEHLSRIMASGDGYQATAEENVTVHHYANVVFNILRGGVFDNQYTVSSADFSSTVKLFNRGVFLRNQALLAALPSELPFASLLTSVRENGDHQLERLAYEYLPITFGRRHGDPSRPWNQFAINLKDESGNGLLSYQGNWRDIFQNWEALLLSFPGYIENVIAKFVNASTMDGYNPYRITKEGIDWEVEEPDDPWSYIGYWGDHQIIYLQKLLELSREFHPGRLTELLREPIFCYANVPYRIAAFDALLADPKNTVTYDEGLAERIEERVAVMGADGKLVLGADDQVLQVNLLEKLLVPLLGKLSNLVVDGGIWLNTQRPEWNDANNALVGQGLSMVTLCYLRRYVRFLNELLASEREAFAVSTEVERWLRGTAAGLKSITKKLIDKTVTAEIRKQSLMAVGQPASEYRESVYRQESMSGSELLPVDDIRTLLDDALTVIDHSISTNRRDDGLYHAYNVLDVDGDELKTEPLYPMLEGQVAALSAGYIDRGEAVEVLEALFESSVYRSDQKSFMLYPDRALPGFLEKNRVDAGKALVIPLLREMLDADDKRIILRDADGDLRFSAEFANVGDLHQCLDELTTDYGALIDKWRASIADLFESVFHHRAFTGRSGTMFGYEGLGSVYWHMVAKLMLAVMENFFASLDNGDNPETRRRLGELYYRIRAGIGFNKTPGEYGAFPTDPYSHTPKHSGARQPGMTGQVKEEIICRFGELGVRVIEGAIIFQPALLRRQEFMPHGRSSGYVDVHGDWQNFDVPSDGLGFTWCQVPIVYALTKGRDPGVVVTAADGEETSFAELQIPAGTSRELFMRSGQIRQITVTIPEDRLFQDVTE